MAGLRGMTRAEMRTKLGCLQLEPVLSPRSLEFFLAALVLQQDEGSIKVRRLAKRMNVTVNAAQTHMNKFKEAGLIESVRGVYGSGRTRYRAVFFRPEGGQ